MMVFLDCQLIDEDVQDGMCIYDIGCHLSCSRHHPLHSKLCCTVKQGALLTVTI